MRLRVRESIISVRVGTASTILAFYAYQKMPLRGCECVSFTRSLWLVPLAIFVLREKVATDEASVATIVGMLPDVLLMLQPSAAVI